MMPEKSELFGYSVLDFVLDTRLISMLGLDYIMNLAKNLISVYPNCRAMLDRLNPLFTEEELRDIIEENNQVDAIGLRKTKSIFVIISFTCGVMVMADIVSKEVRSRMMSKIRSVSKLEDRVSRELWSRRIRIRRNVKTLVGRPDFSIKKYRVVIFLDSCFWHYCPAHAVIPKTNTQYWIEKLNKNKQRDLEVNNYYVSIGWNILRVWEHEVKKDYQCVIDKIINFIENAKICKK
ncbi:Very short patch repair protein [Brevibacillus brevis]|nr:Very short patch repair protein [Brevibacillus brevis]